MAADTLRARRLATMAWIVGGVAFMVVIAYGYVREVANYPGGAPAMGAALEAAAQAMRLLRWPAERLDTFGGYVSYHNVTVLALALGLWSAAQGARLLRGKDAEAQLELVFATGTPRWRVLAGRVTGFAVTVLVIAAGTAVGLAAATAVAGVYDLPGSMTSMAAVGLAALACFGLGLVLAQVLRTARLAAAVAAVVITGLHLLNNVWEELGWLAVLRYLSPFYYSGQYRVLVPGHTVDARGMAVLAAMTVATVGLAAWAFVRRDLGAGLWPVKRARILHAQYRGPGAARGYWRAEMCRKKSSLSAWSLGAALLTGTMAWLEPVAVGMWSELGLGPLLTRAGLEASATDTYLSFASQLVAAVIAVYVLTEAAAWVAEMRDGRVEMYLAQPVSWRRLILARLAMVAAGAAVISAAAAVGLAVGTAAVDASLDPNGLLRTVLAAVLLALAIAGVGAMLVAWLPAGTSVILFSAVVFFSYLLALVVPLFGLPGWVANLSLFGAYGQPYLEQLEGGGQLLLVGLAVAGGVVGPKVAERRPRVT